MAILKLLEKGKVTQLLVSYNGRNTKSVAIDDALGLIANVNLSIGQYNHCYQINLLILRQNMLLRHLHKSRQISGDILLRQLFPQPI